MGACSKSQKEKENKENISKIKKNIKEKLYRTKLKSPSTKKKFRSSVWTVFENIYDETNEQLDYVNCKHCMAVLPYNAKTLGTKHLLNPHCAEMHNASENCENIEKILKSNAASKIDICESTKKRIKQNCVKFIAKDIRPMYAIHGNGLADLLSSFTSIGKKYGELTAREVQRLLSDRTTVSEISLNR